MKLLIGVLTSAALVFSAQAQNNNPFGGSGQLSSDPTVAAQQLQQQAQFTFENELANLQNGANSAKEDLIARRNQLNTQLQQCFISKNEADIGASQQADAATQAATQSLIQGATQGITPLIQNMGTAHNMGKEAAKSQREEAIAVQNAQVNNLMTACPGVSPAQLQGLRINQTGTNATSAVSQTRAFSMAPPGGATNASCAQAANAVYSITASSKREIEQANQAEGSTMANAANIALAAVAVGVPLYGSTQAKKTAKEGLANAERVNQMNYEACQQGITDEAAEIDRQLGNIDRQLASDRERLSNQFAQYKVTVPANIQDKPLPVADDPQLPLIGGLGGSVAPTNLAKNNSFKFPSNDGAGGGGPTGGGAPGGGGAGNAEGGTPGWGFGDPNAPTNSGNLYTIPPQPAAASMIAGSGESVGGGGGAGIDPFGEGFMGFEDPFANVSGAAALADAANAGGNGFWELAKKTRRLVYARLGDLLGKPAGSRVVKDGKVDPNRKISSVRE